MKDLTLCGHIVRVNDDGFVSLTDMWKASGAKRAKEPGKFLKLKDSIEYIKELNTQNLGGLKILKGRHLGGTWACKYIAYKYAGWIDKAFEVGSYKVLDGYFSGHLLSKECWQELHDFSVRYEISKKDGSYHGRGLAHRRHEKYSLAIEEQRLLNKYQHILPFRELL